MQVKISITCQVILGEKAFVDSYHSGFDEESWAGLLEMEVDGSVPVSGLFGSLSLPGNHLFPISF